MSEGSWADLATEIIAKKIIELAREGESPTPGFGGKYWSLSGCPSHSFAAQERFRSRLRTWAAAPDAAQAPAFSAWGSSLRAAPVSWRPCARDGLLPPSRGSCARTVFHTPCGASSHEKCPRVASSS